MDVCAALPGAALADRVLLQERFDQWYALFGVYLLSFLTALPHSRRLASTVSNVFFLSPENSQIKQPFMPWAMM